MFLGGVQGCSLNKVMGHPLTDLLDTVSFISAKGNSILDIPRLPLQSVRRLNALFPRLQKKDLEFDLTTSQSDRIIVWFFRPHD
jgi:hypothetical protein